ncbi:MAG: translation initiation factor IF-2 [Candidatus Bathyarchaeota archaeon]|nr:translation initiation factor IF-2 [Candidatus Bathyarchaeota archaeon]
MPIRQPIVSVLGHIDAGKTKLLDKIRKSSVQDREVGGITQHIGASYFPVETLAKICGPLFKGLKKDVQLPGLLVIDTPGHEAFVNLRKRGGAVADIAILVVDVIRGFEAQTYECLDILKEKKTPFLVAANKIDRVPGWKPKPGETFFASYNSQDPFVQQALDENLYRIMGTFSRLGFKTDKFNNVKDFTQTIAIVPTSAMSGEGIPELLAVLTGLTQQYLQKRLKTTEGPAKGTVLEVKEEPGLGITANVIIYDGTLKKGDLIVVGAKEKPIVTTIRAVFLPKPLDEIRDPRDKFSSVDSVSAAAGVKIAAPNLEDTLAGAPLYSVPSQERLDEYVQLVSEEVQQIKIDTDLDGVVLKTDALGSLEAIADSLKRNEVPIKVADVGDVSRRDVTEASIVKENEPLHGVILAFNVRVLPDAEEEARNRNVPIFNEKTIYSLIDKYLAWLKQEDEARLGEEFNRLVKPAKVTFLPGYVFRKAKPAVVGVEVLAGKIRPKQVLTKEDGRPIGEILQIQDKGKAASQADVGAQVAVSLGKAIVGRHIHEGETFYVRVPEDHARVLLSKFEDRLTAEEVEALKEYIQIMRKESPFWGV